VNSSGTATGRNPIPKVVQNAAKAATQAQAQFAASRMLAMVEAAERVMVQ